MQAQTEPKLHPETANMESEQVITKRSATSLRIALTFLKLFRFQVCGGERTETKTPPRKGRDLFFDVLGSVFVAENLTAKREKKQATFFCKGLAHVYFRVALCF